MKKFVEKITIIILLLETIISGNQLFAGRGGMWALYRATGEEQAYVDKVKKAIKERKIFDVGSLLKQEGIDTVCGKSNTLSVLTDKSPEIFEAIANDQLGMWELLLTELSKYEGKKNYVREMALLSAYGKNSLDKLALMKKHTYYLGADPTGLVMDAVERKQPEMFISLSEFGRPKLQREVNQRYSNGETLLTQAVKNSPKDITLIRHLVETLGADVLATNQTGLTAWDICYNDVLVGQEDTTEILKNNEVMQYIGDKTLKKREENKRAQEVQQAQKAQYDHQKAMAERKANEERAQILQHHFQFADKMAAKINELENLSSGEGSSCN